MSRDDVIAIGQRIKNSRKALRFSQKEMAASLGISSSYLSEIEAGKANPGPEFFLKLAHLFNMHTEYLFHGDGDMFYSKAKSKSGITNHAFDFNRPMDSLDYLLWLLEKSSLFRNTVMAFAEKYLIDNEETVKRSISRTNQPPGEKS